MGVPGGKQVKLTPAQQTELKYLRSQVDHLQQTAYQVDAHPNAKNDHWQARKELTDYVSGLRRAGHTI